MSGLGRTVRQHAQESWVAPARLPGARGYTLVELMLTIALVGILIALALPAYTSYRNKVDQRRTAQTLTTMQVAIRQYFEDNGVFPDSLAAVGQTNLKDAWNQPFTYYNIGTYGKGGARKDKHLNPINTDYDLYSKGPDGQTATQLDNKDSVDDVVRARNGGFIGVSAEF